MCSEFIKNLENKYETMIGENGVKLSGGENKDYQLQELFKKSKIILLDEATSSLDSKTEEKIQKR